LKQSLNGGLSMRTYDLTPFYRSTVGFDRFFNLLDQVTSDGSPGYPPYNIERTGENAYRISVAVSGFSRGEIRSAVPRHRGPCLRAPVPACRFRAGEERLARERPAPRRSRPRDPRGQEAPQHSDLFGRPGPAGRRRFQGSRVTRDRLSKDIG